YFYTDLHIYRVAIFHGWFESPLPHGVNSFCIQAIAQAANHFNVPRMASGVDNEPKDASSLRFALPCRFGVLRIRGIQRFGRGDSVANVVDTAANSAAGAGANAGSVANAD